MSGISLTKNSPSPCLRNVFPAFWAGVVVPLLAISHLPAQQVPYDALEVRIYNQSGTPDSGVSLMGTGNGYSDINPGWWGSGFSMYYTNAAGATVNLRNVLSPANTGYVSSVILTNLPAGSDTNGSYRQMYVDYVASGLMIFGLTTNGYTATNSPGYLQANDNPGGWAGVTWQQAELSYTGGNIPTGNGGVPPQIVSYDTVDVTAINQVGIPLLLQMMTNTAAPGVVPNGTKGFTNTNNVQTMLAYLNAIPGAPWYSSPPNTNVANYVGPSAAAAGGLIMPVCQNTNLTNTLIWQAGWAGATVPTFAPYVKHVFTNPPMLGTNNGSKVFARISGVNGINNENRTNNQNGGATTYAYTFDFTLVSNPRATNLYSTPIPYLTNGTISVTDTGPGGSNRVYSNLWVQYTPDRGSPSNSWFSSYIYQAPPTYVAPTAGSPLTGYITNWSTNWSNLATQYNFPWNYFVVNIFDTMANHIAYGFAGGFVNSPETGTYSFVTGTGTNAVTNTVSTNVGAMPSFGWWQQTNLYADLQTNSPPRWSTPYYSAWGNAIYQCSKVVYSHPISDRVTNLSVSPGLPLQLANSNPNSFLAITLLPANLTNGAGVPVFSNNANFVPLTNALPLWTNTPQVLQVPNTNQAGGVTIPAITGIGAANALWVAADGLPPGLVFNPTSGIVSGTIPFGISGQYLIRLQAGNSNGVGTAALALNVIGPPKNSGKPKIVGGPFAVYASNAPPAGFPVNTWNFPIVQNVAYPSTSSVVQFGTVNTLNTVFSSSNLPPGITLSTNFNANGMPNPILIGTNTNPALALNTFSNWPVDIVLSNAVWGATTSRVCAVLTNSGATPVVNNGPPQWTGPNQGSGAGPVYIQLVQSNTYALGNPAAVMTGTNMWSAGIMSVSNLPSGVGYYPSNSSSVPPQLSCIITGAPTQTTWSFTNTNKTVNVTFVLTNNEGTNNQVVPFEVIPQTQPSTNTSPVVSWVGSALSPVYVNQPIPANGPAGTNYNNSAMYGAFLGGTGLWNAQWATPTNLPAGLYFDTLEQAGDEIWGYLYGIPISLVTNMVTFTVTNRYGVTTTNFPIGTYPFTNSTPNPNNPLYNPGPLTNVPGWNSGGGGTSPVFSGPFTATAGTNENVDWPINVTNYPSVFRVDTNNLPDGLGVAMEWDDANLAFNLSVTGRPTTPGIYTSTVTASNFWGGTTQAYVLTITGAVSTPPQFTWRTNVLVGTQGLPLPVFPVSLQGERPITLTNSPALPPDLRLAQDQDSTWLVIGVPQSGGTNTVSLTASNTYGTNTTNLILRIAWSTPPAPAILPPYKVRGTSGVAFNFQVQATNTTNFSSPNLPAGLSINATSGLIAGTNTGPSAVYSSTITAVGNGGQTNQVFTITITNTNTAPVFTSTNRATGQVGVPFDFTNTATGTAPITFGAVRLPVGLSLVTTSGVITGAPTNAGTNIWTITASNAGGVTTQGLTLAIEPAAGPVPSSFSPTSAIATQGVAFSLQMTASNNPTNWSATGLPTNLTINRSGLITGTPQVNGTNFVILTAVNSNGSGEGYGTLVVRPTVPVFTNTNRVTGKQGQALSFTVAATSSAAVTYSALGLPGNLQINPASGLISSPNISTNGTFTSTITASNWGTTGTQSLVFVIDTALPVFTSTNVVTGTQGVALTPFQATVSNGPATFSQQGLTTNYSFSSAGRLTGTPQLAGTSTVTLFASNSFGSTPQSLQLRIAPAPPTPAPVITSTSAVTGTSGVAFSFAVLASNTTNYAAAPLPLGLSINATSGVITGTNVGPTAVTTSTVTARGAGGVTNQQLRITITNTNVAPTFTSAAFATGQVGVAFLFTNRATGTPTITYGDLGLPGGLGLAPATGVITGTPTASGTNTWTITASNAGGVTQQQLRLAITPSNNVPGPVPSSLSPTSAIATQGVAFSLPMTASNSPTNWSAANLPSGLSINATSGVIFGTNTSNGTNTVKLTAVNSNGSGEGNLTLVVRPTAPVFTSTNVVRGTQGQQVNFSVTATSSATPVTYTATGLPANLTINSDGQIRGIPSTNGTFNAAVVANTWGSSATQSLRLVISPTSFKPVITSPLTASGTQGVSFSYRITATGAPTITYGASPLPSNLTVSAVSGLIAGTPATSGTFNVQITAANGGGTDQKTLVLTIASDSSRAPVITSPTLVFGRQGTLFTGSYRITASNSPTTFGASGLPPGLGVVRTTGVVTGTPSINGTFPATVTASNAAGEGTQSVRFIISIPR